MCGMGTPRQGPCYTKIHPINRTELWTGHEICSILVQTVTVRSTDSCPFGNSYVFPQANSVAYGMASSGSEMKMKRELDVEG